MGKNQKFIDKKRRWEQAGVQWTQTFKVCVSGPHKSGPCPVRKALSSGKCNSPPLVILTAASDAVNSLLLRIDGADLKAYIV